MQNSKVKVYWYKGTKGCSILKGGVAGTRNNSEFRGGGNNDSEFGGRVQGVLNSAEGMGSYKKEKEN